MPLPVLYSLEPYYGLLENSDAIKKDYVFAKIDANFALLLAAIGGGDTPAFVNLGSGTSFTVDWSAGGWFRITPTGPFTIAFTNTPSVGTSKLIVIELVAATGLALTLPAGGTWGAMGAPEFSLTKDLLSVGMRNGESESLWMLGYPGT